eukprot:SAG31_NODE_339_length_17487_cov_20.764435_7_plen_225_part_00
MASYAWTCALARAPWAPRDGAGVLVLDGAAYLLGGWNPHDPVHFPSGDTCSEVWRSEDGVSWRLLGIAPWEGRHYSGWCVHAGRLWVVGGDAAHGHYQRDVWSSADGVDWQCETAEAPWPGRTSQLVAVLDGAMPPELQNRDAKSPMVSDGSGAPVLQFGATQGTSTFWVDRRTPLGTYLRGDRTANEWLVVHLREKSGKGCYFLVFVPTIREIRDFLSRDVTH